MSNNISSNFKRTCIVLTILIVLLGNSCNNSKMEIDGFWLSDYQLDTESNKEFSFRKQLIFVEDDSLYFKSIGNLENGYDGYEIKETFKYTKNGLKISGKELEELLIDIVSKDSMVIDQYKGGTKEVFRKLDPTETPINWSPSNKSYYWAGNTSSVNTKFIDNGLFVDYTTKTKRISIGQWEMFSLKNRTLLIRNSLYPQVFPIDSIKENSVFLSIFDIDKYNYTYEQYEPEIPEELLGEWVFINSEFVNGNLPPPPSPVTDRKEVPEIEYFKIESDSLKAIKKGNLQTRKWVLGGENDLIIFPNLSVSKVDVPNESLSNKKSKLIRNILKIERLTESRLELLVDYDLLESNSFTRRLVFKRKK